MAGPREKRQWRASHSQEAMAMVDAVRGAAFFSAWRISLCDGGGTSGPAIGGEEHGWGLESLVEEPPGPPLGGEEHGGGYGWRAFW